MKEWYTTHQLYTILPVAEGRELWKLLYLPQEMNKSRAKLIPSWGCCSKHLATWAAYRLLNSYVFVIDLELVRGSTGALNASYPLVLQCSRNKF